MLLAKERLLVRLRRMPPSETRCGHGRRSGPCTPRSEGCRGQTFFFGAEVQKMRVEMASMKRDVEHYSRQEHMELRKRYRELTDLQVGCRMHVQITRIDGAKNDLVLSEKETWELIQQLITLLSSQDTYLTVL